MASRAFGYELIDRRISWPYDANLFFSCWHTGSPLNWSRCPMPRSMAHLAATSPLLFSKHQSTTFSAGLTACPRLCTCHQCAASLWLAHGSMCDTEDLSLLPVAPRPVSLDFVKLHSCCPHPQVTASRLTPCWYCYACHTSHVAGGKGSNTVADVFTWLVFPLFYSNSTVFPTGKASKL